MPRHFSPDDSEHFWTTGIDEAAAARLEAQERLIETLTAALERLAAAADEMAHWNNSGMADDALEAARTALAQARKE